MEKNQGFSSLHLEVTQGPLSRLISFLRSQGTPWIRERTQNKDQRMNYQNRAVGRFGGGCGFLGRQSYRGDGSCRGRGFGNRENQWNEEYREKQHPTDNVRQVGIQRDPVEQVPSEDKSDSRDKEQSTNNTMNVVATAEHEREVERREAIGDNMVNHN